MVFRIPPLRRRNCECTLLAMHCLQRFAAELKSQVKGCSPDARAAMKSLGWPGNVRELENRMKSAVIMADGELITAADLDLDGDEEAELMLNLKAARELADRKAIRLALARTEGNISNAAKIGRASCR